MNPALDRLDVLDVLHLYCLAYDEGELALMSSLFLEDAWFRFEPPPAGFEALLEGRDRIHQAMLERKQATAASQRRHLISNVRFDRLAGDEAEVRSYLTLASTSRGQLSILATGLYHDRLRRTAEGWRFASRHLRLDSGV